jgi:hypothetical protein
LNRSTDWRAVSERQVNPISLVVVELGLQDAPQTGFNDYDYMIQALAANRADQALDVGILPWRLRCRENFPNPQAVRCFTDPFSAASIPIAQQIAGRAVLRESFQQLPSRRFGRRVWGQTEMNHATTVERQDDEDKQQVEENCWNHKEVGSNQVFRMVL